jgi:hypothetical protein
MAKATITAGSQMYGGRAIHSLAGSARNRRPGVGADSHDEPDLPPVPREDRNSARQQLGHRLLETHLASLGL